MSRVYAATDLKFLAELVRGIRIVMLTTVCPNGSLRSRPMVSQDGEFDGTLWFFASADPTKIGAGEDEGQVNVSYANPEERRYISISGRAVAVNDRQKMESLWNSGVELWFPKGINDPKLTLLRVDAEKWEYWDAKTDTMLQYDGHLKAPTAEFVHEYHDHERTDLSGVWVSQDVGNTKTRNERG
ncbi:MAG TPA: pyridoxamine 5'-phosphate oxidase family protein [Planctomycetaceae bacterium]|nr:pyridoxamine 5'-phosphate oxidase family protein [Planctomycetaceae bacterium]HQZ67454.1 pyridoxamine 5'-phosphate oxidase family protein [Planctomycetaceae bacterium]